MPAFLRQAEQALGDDVALDLRGAGGDAHRQRVDASADVRVRSGSVADVVDAAAPARSSRCIARSPSRWRSSV